MIGKLAKAVEFQVQKGSSGESVPHHPVYSIPLGQGFSRKKFVANSNSRKTRKGLFRENPFKRKEGTERPLYTTCEISPFCGALLSDKLCATYFPFSP